MKILHLDSSVTGEKSVSRPLSAAAAEKLKASNPGAEYTHRDLVKDSIPHYTAVARLYAHDLSGATGDQKAELERGEAILDEFLGSDIVILGAPMYNFGIPSQLKAWIDLICVPGKTFQYSSNGPEGLCGSKKVVILSSRGGAYGPGSPFEPFDHQEKYLRHLFTFLGVKDIKIITAEGLAMGPDKAAAAIEAAKQKIAQEL